jgi:hypothetical protein
MCPSSAKTTTLLCLLAATVAITCAQARPVASDYGSIQEAIDKNPGQIIELPPGDYPISASLEFRTNNSGLAGPGRIIQSDTESAFITLKGAENAQIRDVTLMRPDGKMDVNNSAIKASNCPNLFLQNVQVFENRTRIPTIEVEKSDHVRILNCRVENYMRISVDDRTRGTDWGFAFNVIDGTGIDVRDSVGILLQGNTVLETELVPTPELQKKYNLGQFCKRNPVKGVITSQKMWDAGYYNAWHQGAAIAVPTPETDNFVQIIGNYIENAAQGLDIHADHVIVSQNIINNAFIGMKAMHGSRNVSIIGNQFSHNDLWAIGLMPGAASHEAGVLAHATGDPTKAVANIDGDSIIANNIISDFGYGTAYWMWKDETGAPIKLEKGQRPFNPPLSNVLIEGNIVYDTGRDKILVNGKPVVEPPRYQWAVHVYQGPGGPQNLHFVNNLFDPGLKGISNVELKP